MRKNITILILSLILVIFQESFLLEFFGGALNPNLIIALCFGFMFNEEYDTALFAALIGGLFLDFLSVGIVGMTSIAIIVCLVLSQWVKRTIFMGAWVHIVFVIASTVFYKVIMSYPDFDYNGKILISCIINLVLSLGFYAILRRFKNRFLSTEYRIKS